MNSAVQGNFGSGKSHRLTVLVEGRTEKLAAIDLLRIQRVNAIRALVAHSLAELRAEIELHSAAHRYFEEVQRPSALLARRIQELIGAANAAIESILAEVEELNSRIGALLAAMRRPRFLRDLVMKYRSWHLRHGSHPPHDRSPVTLTGPEVALA